MIVTFVSQMREQARNGEPRSEFQFIALQSYSPSALIFLLLVVKGKIKRPTEDPIPRLIDLVGAARGAAHIQCSPGHSRVKSCVCEGQTSQVLRAGGQAGEVSGPDMQGPRWPKWLCAGSLRASVPHLQKMRPLWTVTV